MIELKEATDMTFSRFLDEEYSDIMWNMLAERSNPDVEHSFIASIFGSQGSGKCFKQNTKILSNKGIIEAKDLEKGMKVFDECGAPVRIVNKWSSKRQSINIALDFAPDMCLSEDHRVMTDKGLKVAKDIVKGDLIKLSAKQVTEKGTINDYNSAFVYGAFIADGTLVDVQRYCVAKRCKGLRKNGKSYAIMFSNNNKNILERIKKYIDKEFNFTSSSILKASGRGRYILKAYGKDEIMLFKELCGSNSVDKKIPSFIFEKKEAIKGFLDGFTNCDLTCNICTSEKGTEKTEVGFLVKSEFVAYGLLDLLHIIDCWPSVRIRELRSGKYVGNKYVRMTIPAKQVISFFNKIKFYNSDKKERVDIVIRNRLSVKKKIVTNDSSVIVKNKEYFAKVIAVNNEGVVSCVDIEVASDTHLFQFSGGVVSHNSYAGIALCCFLDPNFSVDQIFFNYNDLVYARHKLKPNTAVLIDEQSQSYGLDSHRIMIILANLKEQLRKKSIHFIFCSPTLYEESKSSMYQIETMFIDYENEEAYAALKTREGLTLGNVRIPSPLKVLEDGSTLATKELMDAYQDKKDEHLEKVLGNSDMDEFEERANKVVEHKLFKKAEKIYVEKMGYIPNNTCIQIINKIFPEYHSGVVPLEIAGRIKLNKETSGEWEISGRSVKKKDRMTPKKAVRKRARRK